MPQNEFQPHPHPGLDPATGQIPGVPGKFSDLGSTPGGLDVIVRDQGRIVAVPTHKPDRPDSPPSSEPSAPEPGPAPPVDAVPEPPTPEPRDDHEGKRFKDIPLVKYFVPDENGEYTNIHLVIEAAVPGDHIDWIIPSERQLTEGNGRQILLTSVDAEDNEIVHYIEGGLIYNLTDTDEEPMPLDLGFPPPTAIDQGTYQLTSPDGSRTLDLGILKMVEISHKTSPIYEGSEMIKSRNSQDNPHEPIDPFIAARQIRDTIRSDEAPSDVFTHPAEPIEPTSLRERLGIEAPPLDMASGCYIYRDTVDTPVRKAPTYKNPGGRRGKWGAAQSHNRTGVLNQSEQGLWGLFEGRHSDQAQGLAIGEEARDATERYFRHHRLHTSVHDAVDTMKEAMRFAHLGTKAGTNKASDSMVVKTEIIEGKQYAIWGTTGRHIYVQKANGTIQALNPRRYPDVRSPRLSRDTYASWPTNAKAPIDAGAYELQAGDRILLSAQNPEGQGKGRYLRNPNLRHAAKKLTETGMFQFDAGIVIEATEAVPADHIQKVNDTFRTIDAPRAPGERRPVARRLEEDIVPVIVEARLHSNPALYNALLARLDQTIDTRWGAEAAEKIKARMLDAIAQLEATQREKQEAATPGKVPRVLGWTARKAAGVRRDFNA
jgi:hypothetical protein